jgi:hypothetical protein
MKIISIVNTNYSLPFDDRVNKESISLIKKGHIVDFIVLESKNESGKGLTPHGASFQTLRLLTRNFFPRGKFVVIKLLEWNIRILLLLIGKKWDILWVNDYDGISAIIYGRFVKLFYPQKRIIWDHHELVPDRFLKSFFYRWLIAFSDIVIHANIDRVEYTKSKLPQKYDSKFFVLENYPDLKFAQMEEKEMNADFNKWLDGSEYCLFQGAALTYRKVLECIEAVYAVGDVKLLIMGPCDDQTQVLIEKQWPDFRDKVYITGWVPQSSFFSYMDKGIVSLVFYENIDTNHELCAPNRFFNAILRGIPIICGSNPPMKRIVDEDGVGVFCEKNGEDYKEIATGISIIRNKQDQYRQRCFSKRSKFVWENQETQFNYILPN